MMTGFPVGVIGRSRGKWGSHSIVEVLAVGGISAEEAWLGTHLSGRRVLSSRSTLSMPNILVPLSETRDTRMSMMEMSTSSPSSTFQLLRRYACSPKHQPSATTWGRLPCHLQLHLPAAPSPTPLVASPLHSPSHPRNQMTANQCQPPSPSLSSLPERLR